MAAELSHVVARAYPSPDGERDEDLFGGALNDVVGCRALVDSRGDVEERDLVSALPKIRRGKFDGVSHVAEIQEVDALHHPPGGDVEARDDAGRDSHLEPRRVDLGHEDGASADAVQGIHHLIDALARAHDAYSNPRRVPERRDRR